MEIMFEKPLTPNFVKTNKGRFDVADLDDEELERFINVFSDTLRENRGRRILIAGERGK